MTLPPVEIDDGKTFGVVHVSYTVDAGASQGDRMLTFEPSVIDTSTSDENGNAIAFSTIEGVLTVVPAPEPASLGLIVVGGMFVLPRRRRLSEVEG